jgi:cyclophilin family peptidyl-prolyl cis-trans isomerase
MSAPGHHRPVGHARIEAAKKAREQAERRRRRRPLYLGITAAVVVLVVAGIFLVKPDNSPTVTADSTATTTPPPTTFAYGTGACAPASPPIPPTVDFPGTNGFQSCIDPAAHYTATFATSAGPVVVDLNTAGTPGTVNNFVQLAGYGYYDGTKLFRTDTSIGIIQGGAPHTNNPSDPGPGFTIPDEGGPFTYTPGLLVMARTAQPNSAGSQFFLTVDAKSSALDAQGTYVVFGTVTQGLDVLQKILASNVEGTGGLGGAPSPEVTVTGVTIASDASTPGTVAP